CGHLRDGVAGGRDRVGQLGGGPSGGRDSGLSAADRRRHSGGGECGGQEVFEAQRRLLPAAGGSCLDRTADRGAGTWRDRSGEIGNYGRTIAEVVTDPGVAKLTLAK